MPSRSMPLTPRLRKYFDLVVTDRRRVEDMRFRLQGLRDISGTLASLADRCHA